MSRHDLSGLRGASASRWITLTPELARLVGLRSGAALARVLSDRIGAPHRVQGAAIARGLAAVHAGDVPEAGLRVERRADPQGGGRAAWQWRLVPLAGAAPVPAQLPLAARTPPAPQPPPLPARPPGRPPLPAPPPPSPAARLGAMVREELDLLHPGLGGQVQVRVVVSVGPVVVEGDGRSARAVAADLVSRLRGAA